MDGSSSSKQIVSSRANQSRGRRLICGYSRGSRILCVPECDTSISKRVLMVFGLCAGQKEEEKKLLLIAICYLIIGRGKARELFTPNLRMAGEKALDIFLV